MANHSIVVSEQATSILSPNVAESGIPFVLGTAPVQSASNPAAVGKPVLCTNWDEAVAALGYSNDWESYTLCEFMYSHFKLFGMQPVIFVNLMDPATMNGSSAASDKNVSDHKVKLPLEAINDSNLVVKPQGGTGTAYVLNTDYSTYYDGENLVIELISTGAAYSATKINVAYKHVVPADVTNAEIVTGLEAIELCLTGLGIVPDLICAPGYSHNSVVAAAMAAKAASVNGLFSCKALIDIYCGSSGAKTYQAAIAEKNANNITDKNQIACWPMLGLGDYKFHASTQIAGLMAQVDTGNDGVPYESPSNKNLRCDKVILDDGTEVTLSITQANVLNNAGIVTAINFVTGWVAWGNYTACYPANTDVKDCLIPVSRMFSWVGASLIRTFWYKLDNPMNRRLVDSILDTANIWLNGLVGGEFLYGARVEMLESENPTTALMSGIIKLHVYMTPPSPAQEIDFVLEYDANYITDALS